MPLSAKDFLLEKLDSLSLHKLARFWSQPSVIDYAQGSIAGSVCGASWFLALSYLKMDMIPEARALTLNGGFFHQCLNTPIDEIVGMCGPTWDESIEYHLLPLFSRGFNSVDSTEKMEAYLESGLPKEHQHMM